MPSESGSSLEDLRVLELSGGVAAGYCGKLFAEYGADVIKVEPPSGDRLRRQGPFAEERPQRETGAPWLYLGTRKRSVTLDLAQPSGQRLFRRMVEEANVIVESFPPGYLDSLGIGFEALRAIKRRIVVVSITPYGQSGPKADWRATNLTSFASGGQMSLTGEPDREPLVNGGSQAEYQAGLQAFAAAALAAHQADVTEVPQHVDISAQECMASALELYLPWWAYLKRDISKRRGNVMSGDGGRLPGGGRAHRPAHHAAQLALVRAGDGPRGADRRPEVPRQLHAPAEQRRAGGDRLRLGGGAEREGAVPAGRRRPRADRLRPHAGRPPGVGAASVARLLPARSSTRWREASRTPGRRSA